ncbi:MAG: hypothetical protein RL685_5263 [Pseudomonadota bacterium]|jgi:hypothetical protein
MADLLGEQWGVQQRALGVFRGWLDGRGDLSATELGLKAAAGVPSLPLGSALFKLPQCFRAIVSSLRGWQGAIGKRSWLTRGLAETVATLAEQLDLTSEEAEPTETDRLQILIK